MMNLIRRTCNVHASNSHFSKLRMGCLRKKKPLETLLPGVKEPQKPPCSLTTSAADGGNHDIWRLIRITTQEPHQHLTGPL